MTSHRAAAGGDSANATPESGIVWVYHFQPDGTAELTANEAVGARFLGQRWAIALPCGTRLNTHNAAPANRTPPS